MNSQSIISYCLEKNIFNDEEIIECTKTDHGSLNTSFLIVTNKSKYFLKRFDNSFTLPELKGVESKGHDRFNVSLQSQITFKRLLPEPNIISEIVWADFSDNIIISRSDVNSINLMEQVEQVITNKEFANTVATKIARVHSKSYEEVNGDKTLYNEDFLEIKRKFQYEIPASFLVDPINQNKVINFFEDYKAAKHCLVHGDFCFLNIVSNNLPLQDFTIIDFENAHIGDGVFDVGYILSDYLIALTHYKLDYSIIFEFLEAYLSTTKQTDDHFARKIALQTAIIAIFRIYGIAPSVTAPYITEEATKIKILKLCEQIISKENLYTLTYD